MICSKKSFALIGAFTLLLMFSCSKTKIEVGSIAPGAPGNTPYWNYSGKTGIGTSYEAYLDGHYSNEATTGQVSKVWFSIANGIITETMFGLIHEAQLKDFQFIVVGKGFVDLESEATTSTIEYLDTDADGRPLSLAYKVISKDIDGKYEIEKHIFTNPDTNALFVRAIFRSTEKGIVPYLYVNPYMNNTGVGDRAWVTTNSLNASEADRCLTVMASQPFKAVSAGFVGSSCGLTDLQQNGVLDSFYESTGSEGGNVALTAQLKNMTSKGVVYDFVVGFGHNLDESSEAAAATLKAGYTQVLAHYNGEGDLIGWSDYLDGLSALKRLYPATTDGGKLLNVSAMVLKAQEDKSNAGAIIASLSYPWGETAKAEEGSTGYKAVWPRDFYQCAMALLALGDTVTPLVAFEYLEKVQVKTSTPGNQGATGWFLQKTHVDGEVEWVGVQLDQTAMPIMLGWKLWKAGILTDEKMIHWYHTMLKPAAEFLSDGGAVDINWLKFNVTPPLTHQERWEEQWGYSPSTTAAVVTGLVTASELAQLANDDVASVKYAKAADLIERRIEKQLFTTTGVHCTGNGNGKYFIRITRNDNPNDGAVIGTNNGREGMNETAILDGGFLELVRYGVRNPLAESILQTLPEYDGLSMNQDLKVKYLFKFDNDTTSYPGWRRYGNDGYGEDETDGSNYGKMTSGQRGRVWPIFTGERGHYELARLIAEGHSSDSDQIELLRNTYIKALEYFANEGYMLPEQVWDGVGVKPEKYKLGEGTNSATPLAWTHAEYIKLVRSLTDRAVWDRYSIVERRYSKSQPAK